MIIKKRYKKHIIVLLTFLAALLIYAVLSAVSGSITSAFPEQQTADRWSDDDYSFAHIAAYFPGEYYFDDQSCMMYKRQLESALAAESITTADFTENENARLYAVGYSGEVRLSVSYNSKSVSSNVIATGEDFFIFHQMELISGSFYDESDSTYDRMVIDENLAWQLFGSSDVCGMSVTVNNVPMVVTGVVSCGGSGEEFTEYYGSAPRAYIPIKQLQRLGYEPTVTAFELLIPNPVDGFAMNIVDDWFGSDTQLVEISSRFDDTVLLKNLSGFFRSATKTDNRIYPYWENLQLIAESKAEFIMIFRLAMIAVTVICIFTEAIILYCSKKAIADGIVGFVKNAVKKIPKKSKKKKGKVTVNESMD